MKKDKSLNLLRRFIKSVNRKYKNSNYSYDQVRQALLTLSHQDDQLCLRKGKDRLTTLKRLVKLTKKELRRTIQD